MWRRKTQKGGLVANKSSGVSGREVKGPCPGVVLLVPGGTEEMG